MHGFFTETRGLSDHLSEKSQHCPDPSPRSGSGTFNWTNSLWEDGRTADASVRNIKPSLGENIFIVGELRSWLESERYGQRL
jgi:hypothetical protein